MAEISRVLLFAAFAFLGLVVPSPALPTTTQTTTTTTTSAPLPSPIAHRVEVDQNPCVRCQEGFDQYRDAIINFDMSATAAFMDELCDTTLPAVEQCMIDSAGEQCQHELRTPWLAHNTFLCQSRSAIQAGVACWAQEGLQRGMTECREALILAGPSVPACEGMNNMWQCMKGKMEQMSQCDKLPEQKFVFDYMTFGAHQICGTPLSFDV